MPSARYDLMIVPPPYIELNRSSGSILPKDIILMIREYARPTMDDIYPVGIYTHNWKFRFDPRVFLLWHDWHHKKWRKVEKLMRKILQYKLHRPIPKKPSKMRRIKEYDVTQIFQHPQILLLRNGRPTSRREFFVLVWDSLHGRDQYEHYTQYHNTWPLGGMFKEFYVGRYRFTGNPGNVK
jgi:hypothetical protein